MSKKTPTTDEEKQRIRKQTSIDTNDLYLLANVVLQRYKDHDYLIKVNNKQLRDLTFFLRYAAKTLDLASAYTERALDWRGRQSNRTLRVGEKKKREQQRA